MNHIYTLTSTLARAQLENVRVLLRADLNVPLHNDAITSDFRLQALRPTLDLLMQKKAQVLLVTHIGQPTDQDSHLSTKLLLPWFKKHGYPTSHAQTIEDAAKFFAPAHITVLENVRFWPGEKARSQSFAHSLRAVTDFFVQDAFGTLHRNDTTIAQLPLLYPEEHRTIGLLVAQELAALNTVLVKPKKPVLAFIGGAKIATKLPLINNLLTLADTIALLPPLSLTFAHAKNQTIGCSLIDTSFDSVIRATLTTARKKNKRIILPIDYVVSRHGWTGPYETIAANAFEPDHKGITIGPETVKMYHHESTTARTIIFNGPSGDLLYPKTCSAMRQLFASWCPLDGYRLVAGADSIAFLQHFNLQTCINYCSSGGGASITYLSGKELPGLEPFVAKKN